MSNPAVSAFRNDAPAFGHGRASATATAKLSIYGKLTIAFLVLLPVEGVLRKWVFPSIDQIFGFVRDPVLLAIYVYYCAQLRGRVPRWLVWFAALAGAFVMYSLIAAILNDIPLLALALGLRGYIAYIPLAFILGERLNAADMRALLIAALAISIPVALLVLVQFGSPVYSPINKGISDDIKGRFVVVAGVVRPYGPFTFAQAQATFAALMVAVWLIAVEKRRDLRIPTVLIAASAFAIATMGALSGARTFFGHALLVVLAFAVSTLTAPRASRAARRLAVAAFALAGFLVVFTVVFPRASETMAQRQAEAQAQEGSTVMRALRYFTDPFDRLGDAPLLGYGPGAGSNAVTRLTSKQGFVLGETEWVRMINELGPVMGLCVIGLRTTLTIMIAVRCVRTNRRSGDDAALIMFGFAGYLLLIAQTTGQNQILSFCWLGIGLTLALDSLARRSAAQGSSQVGHPIGPNGRMAGPA